jgi:hypothetical protein
MRVDTASLIAGSLVCGDRGLGVLGSAIPSTGGSGAGYAYNDLSLPADAGKEICGRITSWPSSGTLYAYEDTSFTFSGAADGSYSFDYQLYVDGAAVGSPVSVALQVGAATATFTATTADATFSGSATVAGASVTATFAATTADATFSGAAISGSFSGSISDADITRIVNAVLAALNATTIPVDAQKMNGAEIIGDGSEVSPWRGVGVVP